MHREQGKSELRTDSGGDRPFPHWSRSVSRAAEAAESLGVFGRAVSDSVIAEHFVI